MERIFDNRVTSDAYWAHQFSGDSNYYNGFESGKFNNTIANRAIHQIGNHFGVFVSIYWPSELDANLKIDDDLSWQFTAYVRVSTLNSLLTAANSTEKRTHSTGTICATLVFTPSIHLSLFFLKSTMDVSFSFQSILTCMKQYKSTRGVCFCTPQFFNWHLFEYIFNT